MRLLFYVSFLLLITPKSSISQTVIKMKSQGGVSVVPCVINGLKLNFIFDTGASDVSLSLTEASFMLKNGYLDTTDIFGTSKYLDANGNINEGVVVNLREVEIGGVKMFNIKASISKSIKAPLLLGQSAISKLGRIQIDLSSNTLTLYKNGERVESPVQVAQQSNVDSASAIEADSITKKGLLNIIREKWDEDDYQSVIEYCDKLLRLDDKNEDALYYSAYAKYKAKDYEGSIQNYSKIIEINPVAAKAYCFRALTKSKQENFNGAFADLNKSIAIDPKFAYAYKVRGDLKLERNNIRESIQDYNIAIQLEPNDPEYFYDRGYAKGELKEYRSALADMDKAIQLGFERPHIYINRGNMKLALEDYSGAYREFNRSIELQINTAESYFLRGVAKENLEDYEGAIEDYTTALGLDSSYSRASIRIDIAEDKMINKEWINAHSQDGQKWFIKSKYVSKNNSVIKVWIKEEMKNKVIKRGGRSVNYQNAKMLMLTEFNCSSSQAKINTTIYYDSKGNVLQQSNDEGEWEDIIPGTIIEALYEKVCKVFK